MSFFSSVLAKLHDEFNSIRGAAHVPTQLHDLMDELVSRFHALEARVETALHHSDPVVATPAAATGGVQPQEQPDPVVTSTITVPVAPSTVAPEGSPAANAAPGIMSMVDAGHENQPAAQSAQPTGPAENRDTGIVDRIGSPRYWKGVAGQPCKLLVPVGTFTGVAQLDVSGDAPGDGTPVEAFSTRVEDAVGNVLVQESQWIRYGQLSVSVGPGTGDFYVVVTPATDGAGFVQRTA